MRTSIASVVIVAFLAGCTTTAEQAAQAEREVARMVQVYGPACEKLGFQRDTDSWRNCVINLSQKEEIRHYNNSALRGPLFWRYPYPFY
jgi:hypothetical protein